MKLIFFSSIFAIILSCKTNDPFEVKKLDKNEQYNFISSHIKSKEGADLGNFIFHLQESKINLKPFEKLLIDKLRSSQYPYDINIITNLLIDNKENKSEIEEILKSKIKIWDIENWSENFWSLIKEYNLNVEKPNYYKIESDSSKKYDVSAFMKVKIENDELGKYPLLMVNWNIVSYEEGKLIETLNQLDIKQIDFTPKSQSVKLYGKRGVDGLLHITSN